ncbi:DUF6053 domain-containing protein [Lysobacter sp. TAB13]|uniref:DUF6053 domain-containing protein n=1 Tax=Lysobacter sp. TAB13 TaxID=3233065 RepID=UPI003F947724
MWEGALAPMLLLQVAVKFHRVGAKGIGPEGPPTKAGLPAKASCRDTLEPPQRGIRSKPSSTGS